jgi:putative queuosine salvage protein
MDDMTITPPRDDRLGVLTSTATVVRAARLVRIERERIVELPERWAAAAWPEGAGSDTVRAMRLGDERAANVVLLLNALNFCFWGEPGQSRWLVEWRGRTLDGFAALMAALARAVDEGRPVWDAGYLAALDDAELGAMLRPAPRSTTIPLFAARLAHAREVGRVLLERYGGSFARVAEAADGSAVDLTHTLARDFPSFNDVATWNGHMVRFYKRAQICVADLRAAVPDALWARFRDMERLTAFADYKLPQLLRWQGALVYAPELAAQVDGYVPLAAGSDAEIEIRAATIWAVELLRRALVECGVARTASEIDQRLWMESQHAPPDMRPYHRTRTIYY